MRWGHPSFNIWRNKNKGPRPNNKQQTAKHKHIIQFLTTSNKLHRYFWHAWYIDQLYSLFSTLSSDQMIERGTAQSNSFFPFTFHLSPFTFHLSPLSNFKFLLVSHSQHFKPPIAPLIWSAFVLRIKKRITKDTNLLR